MSWRRRMQLRSMKIQITSQCLKFDIAMQYDTASNDQILLPLYGKYLAMDLDCDGTQQAV